MAADPDALPPLIEWKVGSVVLTTIPRLFSNAEHMKPAQKKNTLRHYVPEGATGWRLPGQEGWRPLDCLHVAWGLEPLAPPPEDMENLTEEELREIMDRKIVNWLRRRGY